MEITVHGCQRHRMSWPLLFLMLAAGCDDAQPPQPEVPAHPMVEAASEFDPTTAGIIQGQVLWSGDIPEVPLIQDRVHVFEEGGGWKITRENPNAPAVNPRTQRVVNAVVYLRGIDPKRGRPWDHPPVRVEQRDYRLHIRQGETDSRAGLVRRGEAIEMISTQPIFHSLRASGAAFFTLAFPDPDQPLLRRLEHRGMVELCSAAGFYWMRAYLLVDDHPYYARTDAEGRFTLPQVPPGRYQVVCWIPNWHKQRHERNPDTGLVTRWFFRLPVELVQPVTLQAGESRRVAFTVSAEAFQDERPAIR
jgi:hypothetical protein